MQKTILVVDDDPLYVELVKDLLELHHHCVVTALSAPEALRILQQQPVDVIVSDIEMPMMNGVAFHKRVNEQVHLRSIPFIFLTGSEEQHHFRYVDEHPPLRLIRKTEMVEELLTLIGEVTHRQET